MLKEKMKRTQLYLTQDMYEQVKKMADLENSTIAEIVRMSLKQILITNNKKKETKREKLLSLAGKYSGVCTDPEAWSKIDEIVYN